jgi:hypothetical protein
MESEVLLPLLQELAILHPAITSSLLGPNILLSTLFSNTLNLCCFLNARGQVSHPYKPTGKIVALYILILISTFFLARRMRWAGHVARMGEVRGAYNILVGGPEGRRPLGRPRRRWENIKMDLRERWFGDVDWIHWAQDRDRWRALVNTVMNLRLP